MKLNRLYKGAVLLIIMAAIASCTNLDQHVYSVVPINNFFQTPEQIAAGVAPAYQQLTSIPAGNVFDLQEATSDEMIIPTRGTDWYDGGKWQQLWLHTWTPQTNTINDAWKDIYNGIGKVNFTLSIVNGLENKPDKLENINAELKTLRAYYYYLAMDLYGNVPLVTDFNTNPDSVTNSSRKEVFNFIESELKSNISKLSSTVDATTYGRVTKWMAFALMARLYLNAKVYTGTAHWQDCINACDSVIMSNKYSLEANYFDNFSVDNEGSSENIFVVPFDNVNIGGNSMELLSLHYQNQINFQLSGSPYNGFCSPQAFYSLYDTTSDYKTNGANTYRTYRDQRAGMWLVGQQFSQPYTYPQYQNVLYSSTDESLKLKDAQTGLSLSFDPHVNQLSNSSDKFRLVGARNIKYFPEANTAGNQSNDMVIFRLADVYLMKAEAEVRLNQNLPDALNLINKIRDRAFSGGEGHDWKLSDLTLDNIQAERGREMAWEGCRRTDDIRFGTFGNARTPEKSADADDHTDIFPIPKPQITANPNLQQNPGY